MEEFNSKIDSKISQGYNFKYKEYLYSALELLKVNWINYAAHASLFLIAALASLYLKGVGSFLLALIGGPLIGGFFISTRKIDLGQKTILSDFFKGFYQPYVLNIISAFIFMNIITSIGLFLLIVPGIYFMVAFSFTIPLVIYKNFRPWTAIEASRQLITKQFFEVFVFILILSLLNLIGGLLYGIGLVFTIPFTYVSIYFAYKDIIGFDIVEKESEDTNMNYFR